MLKDIIWVDLEIPEFKYGEHKISKGYINDRVMTEIIIYKWSGCLGSEDMKMHGCLHTEYLINFVSCFGKHKLRIRNKNEFTHPYKDNEYCIYSTEFSLDKAKEISYQEIEEYFKSFLK